MERSYRRTHARRRTPARSGGDDPKARSGAIKLAVCAGLFVLAALIKLLFPAFYAEVGERITTAIDYKTALTVLGEGLSGERKFTTAVGEAFAYAFRGAADPAELPDDTEQSEQSELTDDTADGGAIETFGEAADVSGEPDALDGGESNIELPVSDAQITEGAAEADVQDDSLAEAIISAFMQTQEGFSDYSVPAGATYDMPAFGISYAAPVSGRITSGFGYRQHPTDGEVKFHYGVDMSADEGTPIKAFADGEVIAVGESTTLGKYILISHDGAETKYAHCSEVLVSSGQAVKMGEELALAGSTGNATSSCLHFELLINGVWVNPEYYLSQL